MSPRGLRAAVAPLLVRAFAAAGAGVARGGGSPGSVRACTARDSKQVNMTFTVVRFSLYFLWNCFAVVEGFYSGKVCGSRLDLSVCV